MKKTLIIALAALAAAGAQAAELPFEAKAPAIEKVATPNSATPVHMYKMSMKTAPQLVLDIANYDEFAAAPDLFWSNEVSRRHQGDLPFTGYARVTGEKAQWVNISYPSNGARVANFYSCWVPAGSIATGAPATLTPADADGVSNLAIFPDGDLAGYGLYATANEEAGTVNIYVGKLVDGKLVCPFVLADIQVKADGNSALDTDGLHLAASMLDGTMPRLSAFPAELAKSIIASAQPTDPTQCFVVLKLEGSKPAGAFYAL